MIPAPGPHGDDAAAVARHLGLDPGDVVDLAQTLNPAAPDVARVVGRHLGALARYPEPTHATACLAGALDVDPRRVVLTNGGSEAIALVATELGAGWVDEPDFALYRRHLATLSPDAGRWRSNPHNPSGRLAPPGERAAVWDEAFWPLTTGSWTRGDADDGSVVVGSLTKLFACPGLRAGYVLAPDADLADTLRARQPRWSVNGLVTSALPDLLESIDLTAASACTRELRDGFRDALRPRGLDVDAADAPWVLVRHPGLRDALAPHGVVVRDCTSFGWPGVFRLAVPRPDQRARVLAALDRVLEEEVTSP